VARGGRRATDRPGQYPPVLVADSYHGVRHACARYLGHFHFQVAEATNGEEALGIIGERLPHLILTESSLPLMPASRLTQWLAQSWRTREIPIIVMTHEVEPEGLPYRTAGVLVKPFTLADMLEEIRRVLRTHAVTA
jgi:DNA-binding response OmpR family regulator